VKCSIDEKVRSCDVRTPVTCPGCLEIPSTREEQGWTVDGRAMFEKGLATARGYPRRITIH
jgi:hypothetical protein